MKELKESQTNYEARNYSESKEKLEQSSSQIAAMETEFKRKKNTTDAVCNRLEQHACKSGIMTPIVLKARF